MYDKTHTNAAVILCGLTSIILNHYGMEMMNILLIFGIFMIITVGGDIREWRPFINKAPKVAKLSLHPIIGPLMLCMVISVIVGISVGFLMIFWIPLVEPLIDSMKEVMEQIATWNIEKETVYMLLYVFVVVIAAQLFRITRYWITGRRR